MTSLFRKQKVEGGIMENQFMIPIGIEDFKEIREEGYYCLPGRAALENH